MTAFSETRMAGGVAIDSPATTSTSTLTRYTSTDSGSILDKNSEETSSAYIIGIGQRLQLPLFLALSLFRPLGHFSLEALLEEARRELPRLSRHLKLHSGIQVVDWREERQPSPQRFRAE